jgi:hypothetical protein
MCYVLLCATVIIVLLSYTTFIHLFFCRFVLRQTSPIRVGLSFLPLARAQVRHGFVTERQSKQQLALPISLSPSDVPRSFLLLARAQVCQRPPVQAARSFPLLARAQVPQQPPQSKQQLALRYSSPRSYSLPISLSPSGPPTLFFFSIAGAQVRHGAPDQATRSGSVPVHLLAHCRCFY